MLKFNYIKLGTIIIMSSFLLVSLSLTNIGNNNNRMVFASSSDDSKCQDSADKISKSADGHASGKVCEIGLSRDSPTIKLQAKQGQSKEKVNEITGMEIKYQPVSASSSSKVLMIAELQLKQTEVNRVQKSLLNNGWQVTAIHNHELLENPLMIYLHAQKSDNLDDSLKDVKNALEKTDCSCT